MRNYPQNTAQNCYPFGMSMQSYSNIEFNYSYGMNTQEKDDEIYGEGNSYSAEYWQYDARLGRRWNNDPRPNPSMSVYACFGNNPIFTTDINGDTTWVFDEKGNFLNVINDDKPNETHFINAEEHYRIMYANYEKKEDGSYGIKDPNTFATDIRNNSTAFYTKKTEAVMKQAFKNSPTNGEIGFALAFKVGSRELEFLICTTCTSNDDGDGYSIDLSPINQEFSNRTVFAVGHSHPSVNSKPYKPTPPEVTKYNVPFLRDYKSVLQNAENGHPALIISESGITIYHANNKMEVLKEMNKHWWLIRWNDKTIFRPDKKKK